MNDIIDTKMGALDQRRLNKTEFIRANIIFPSTKSRCTVGESPHTLDQPLHFNLSSVQSLANPLLFPCEEFDNFDLPRMRYARPSADTGELTALINSLRIPIRLSRAASWPF